MGMFLLEKKAVVFRFRQVVFHNAVNQLKNFLEFRICHSFGDDGHELVVGKFLKIVDDRIFIGFAICAESHQAAVIFNKVVAVKCHIKKIGSG